MSPLGPALATRPRAPAPSRFLGTFPRYTSSAARARAPVLASAPGRCAHPTRPGGLRSPALDRPPRLNPDASLGFLGLLRSGGDFLSAPPPPRHEGKCSVRTDAPYFFFFFSKLTELFQCIPIPFISLTAYRKAKLQYHCQGLLSFRPLPWGHCLCVLGDFLHRLFFKPFQLWRRAGTGKIARVIDGVPFYFENPECSFTMCISETG